MAKKNKMCLFNFGLPYDPGTCPYCKRKFIPSEEFRDLISVREYWASGLCQECQDSIFEEGGRPPVLPMLECPEFHFAPRTMH